MKNTLYTNNGTYGCVFRPAISCKGELLDKNTVSKVFKNPKISSEEEVKIHNNLVNHIDPDGYYTVKLIEDCPVEMQSFKPSEVKKCNNFTSRDFQEKYLQQIVYEYGGIDLMQASRKFSFEELFKALERVFVGLQKLEINKYIHADIKPENMVYNNTTGKLSLIDFGLATKTNKLYQQDKLFMLCHPYQYYPPEFPLIANGFLGKQRYFAKQNVIKLETLLIALRKYKIPEVEDLIDQMNRNIINPDVFDYPHKTDVYMLGASILELIYLCDVHNTLDIGKNKIFYSNVFLLIGNMIEPEPGDRFTPDEAFDRYKEVVKLIKRVPPPSPKISTARVQNIQNVSPKQKVEKICPPGTLLNPLTKRCNKIKNKPNVEKVCPPGTVLNPVTKRCNKIKNKQNVEKICPPGTVLNPVTKRCNKIKQ